MFGPAPHPGLPRSPDWSVMTSNDTQAVAARRPLALCHYTMIEVPPPEFVDLAARNGFAAVSLMLQFPAGLGVPYPIHGDTVMRRETKLRLDDTGVTLYDASTCRLEPDTDVETFRPMLESAAYLGAKRFNVNGNDPDP